MGEPDFENAKNIDHGALWARPRRKDETPLQQLDRGTAQIVKDGDGYKIVPITAEKPPAKPRRKRTRKPAPPPLHEALRALAEMNRPSMVSEVSRRLLELAARVEAGR